MTEDYVSFPVAKLLKDKGFDEHCNSFYDDTNGLYEEGVGNFNSSDQDEDAPHSSRPTQALACKWLREKHGIHIEDMLLCSGKTAGKYTWQCYRTNGQRVGEEQAPYYSTPEQAIEAGLLHTLKHLI